MARLRRALLSLGSNLPPRAEHLRAAVRALEALHEGDANFASSDVFETAPWGLADQPDYLNLVVALETSRDPEALLRETRAIEHAAGRTREVRWGPRTLDIDIIAVGELVCETDALTLPHPRAMSRAFVLAPLLDCDPGFVHPKGISARAALDALGAEGRPPALRRLGSLDTLTTPR